MQSDEGKRRKAPGEEEEWEEEEAQNKQRRNKSGRVLGPRRRGSIRGRPRLHFFIFPSEFLLGEKFTQDDVYFHVFTF